MTPLASLLLYLGVTVGGLFLEAGVMRAHYLLSGRHYKEHHFTWSKYALWLSVPLLASAFWVIFQMNGLALAFFVFALVGTTLEWIIGFTYHSIVGERLWTYHRLAIGRYTSWLAVPFWGCGGILFWLLNRALLD